MSTTPRNASPARHLRALQRRVDFLRGLADEGRANGFDNAERRSLNWAIGELCRTYDIPRPIGQKEQR